MFYIDADWAREQLAGSASATVPWPQAVLPSPTAAAWVDRIEGALRSRGNAARRRTEIARCLRRLSRLATQAPMPAGVSADPAIAAVRTYLDAHCFESATVGRLARLAGMSPFRLIRRFKREFGLTPHAYQLDLRVNQTRDLLRRGHSLADIAYATGFNDQSHFQRAFKLRVAATPAEYRGRVRLRPRWSR